MRVIVVKEVERCVQCPYFRQKPNIGSCDLMREMYGFSRSEVLPYGRRGIHGACPIQQRQRALKELQDEQSTN